MCAISLNLYFFKLPTLIFKSGKIKLDFLKKLSFSSEILRIVLLKSNEEEDELDIQYFSKPLQPSFPLYSFQQGQFQCPKSRNWKIAFLTSLLLSVSPFYSISYSLFFYSNTVLPSILYTAIGTQ